MKKINTEFVYPPIPIRNFDWCATFDDYDCDCDQDGYFSHDPVGYGRTKQDAIDDLLEQVEDAA